MNAIERKLEEMNIVLPVPKPPIANFVPYVKTGNLVFIAGQTSVTADGEVLKGRLGENLTLEQGQLAARACALNLIAQMKLACDGDLVRVRRIVKLGGFVSSSFAEHQLTIPKIINACSDLLVEIFGDAGRHARFAVGVAALPRDCAVEIDAVIELENENSLLY